MRIPRAFAPPVVRCRVDEVKGQGGLVAQDVALLQRVRCERERDGHM
jgi:hypothetical protein